MSRPSSITKLPEAIRSSIAKMRDDGCTLDDIVEAVNAALTETGIRISRSAMGRHIQSMDEIVEKMRESRAIAESIGRSFGDEETSKVARLNLEMMQSIIMRLMIATTTGESAQFNPDEAMKLSKAMDHMAKAGKTDFDKQLQVAKENERKMATQAAADKAVSSAKKQGLSASTINVIRASILGIEP